MSGAVGGRDLGLSHETHPLLGRLVVDTDTGRVGVLRAVVRNVPGGEPRAWLRPEGGGVEWTAAPETLVDLDRPLRAGRGPSEAS